jgi:hypothetical protein
MGCVIEKGNYAPELDTIFPRFISEFLLYLVYYDEDMEPNDIQWAPLLMTRMTSWTGDFMESGVLSNCRRTLI